ncbi:very short patch repair endonuclease [uncultured Methanolobus sp.]|uniref:very short patch repair endonuclease n=1 Tax=uncultured Methanolobus sp. TaxID=218300 RepID=UPI0029C938C2|nr:very short patch repair endonuclease [uncultured Methanolobus sp.]
MVDVHSRKQRSYNMSQIKGKDTKPEMIVRKWLWNNRYRYRLHQKNLPGKPDIVFPGKKKAIFVNGCFWHKHDCKYFKWPKSNTEFWNQKIEGNVKKDAENYSKLVSQGWKYLVIWECELKRADLTPLWNCLKDFIDS